MAVTLCASAVRSASGWMSRTLSLTAPLATRTMSSVARGFVQPSFSATLRPLSSTSICGGGPGCGLTGCGSGSGSGDVARTRLSLPSAAFIPALKLSTRHSLSMTLSGLRSFASFSGGGVNANSNRVQADSASDSDSDGGLDSSAGSECANGAVKSGQCAATVGQPAPEFTASGVVAGELKSNVSLSQFRGKYVVLLFYPSDFTFVCPTELVAFAERYQQFQALNCEVLAVSVDSQFAHLAWEHTSLSKGGIGQLPFPLLSDSTRTISSAYNVLLPEQGIDLRATFILDERGVIRSVQMNDVQVGRSVEEIVRLVQAFQYSEVHGRVMPCDWKPGMEAIKAEPRAASAYFKKLKDPAEDMRTTASARPIHTQASPPTPVDSQCSNDDDNEDSRRNTLSGQN